MNYAAIDLEVSGFVLTARKNNTRFFITDDGLATDIPGKARRFRHFVHAEGEALEANNDPQWAGFKWFPTSVPNAYNLAAAGL